MADATIPEAFTDLLDAHVATLATIGRDGRPQLSAVWFLHENGEVRSPCTPPGRRPRTSNAIRR